MPEQVHVIGAARTDFKRNLRKEGKSLRDVIVEAGRGAIADAGIDPGDIRAGIVGNFAAGLFTRQLHLGAYLTEVDPKLRGMPTLHTEAACASGGVAVLTAAQQIAGGIYDVVLVVGAEQQKTMSPADGSDVLGAAADYHAEKQQYGEFMFPKLFARIAEIYMSKHELSERHLAMVSAKNYAHARLNPQAQMRESAMNLQTACGVSEGNPRIAAPLKISDCSQITDGAAAIVLCSDRFAQKLSRRSTVRLLGWGHATDHLPLEKKDVPEFPIARAAAKRAYDTAGITPRQLSGVDVHDCFSIHEIVAYELLGLAERGRGPKLLESEATMLPAIRSRKPDRSIPVNPGGGLIGDGHPVGATGVRQVVEAYTQLTGKAGQRQIENASQYLCYNVGGSVTTVVITIWGRE